LITFQPETPIFEAGTRAVIRCIVESKAALYSNHQINWIKNANRIQNGEKFNLTGEYLIINQIAVEDAGKYTCKVAIGQSIAKKHITVKVYGNIFRIFGINLEFKFMFKMNKNKKKLIFYLIVKTRRLTRIVN
jgi:hypothetical protein